MSYNTESPPLEQKARKAGFGIITSLGTIAASELFFEGFTKSTLSFGGLVTALGYSGAYLYYDTLSVLPTDKDLMLDSGEIKSGVDVFGMAPDERGDTDLIA